MDPNSQDASQDIRKFSLAERRCKFEDEVTTGELERGHFLQYTQETCRLGYQLYEAQTRFIFLFQSGNVPMSIFVLQVSVFALGSFNLGP